MARNKNSSGYLPSLDGWRCLAILGVLWAHDVRWVILGHSSAYAQGMGAYGVPLFFALSGLLITWRILQDEERAGRFSLKAFYLRRFFRIQPAQWVYLAIVALLMVTGLVHAPWRYWWGAVLLYQNFLWHPSMALGMFAVTILVGHFWTLAVEEHFYLLISVFFRLIQRHRVLLLGAALVALLAGQEWGRRRGLFSDQTSGRRTYWVVQYLLFASWISLLLRQPGNLAWARRYWHPLTAFLVTGFVLYAHHLVLYGPNLLGLNHVLGMDQPALYFSFAGWLVATMLHPRSVATRFLELPPMRFVGRISYSIYLWHLLFFGMVNPEVCASPFLRLLNGVPQKYVCTFAVAVLSYYLVEKPMIRLGHRLAPPATPGHRDFPEDRTTSRLPDASGAQASRV